jgi:hypothetical protein
MRRLLFLGWILLLLSSCSPRVTTKLTTTHTPLNNVQDVTVVNIDEKVSIYAIEIGTVKVKDNGLTIKCNYGLVIEIAKTQARIAGGDILKIVKHSKPNILGSSCHQIEAKIFKIDTLSLKSGLIANGPNSVILKNEGKIKKAFKPFRKGDVRLDLKLPHFNYLALNPNTTFRDSKIGFNGYGIGFEYSYADNKFLETSASLVATFELPFPAHIDRAYNKSLYSYYFSFTDNFIKRRFSAGYGLNYSSNYWNEWQRNIGTKGLPITSNTEYLNKTLGITLNSYYKVDKSLSLGLIYRPSLLKVNDNVGLSYEHLISLELNWRIKLLNYKNRKSHH